MGACARNMQCETAEIKPAQCCIKLVFHLTYTCIVLHFYHRFADSPNPFSPCLQGVPFTFTQSMAAASFLCDKDFVLKDRIQGTIYTTDYLTLGLLTFWRRNYVFNFSTPCI